MEKNKISLAGKIIAIFSSIMAIVMVSGKWLDLYQIPMLFGDSMQHEYSLFEISDFMDNIFKFYSSNEGLIAFFEMLSIGAIAVIVMSVLTIILALINSSLSKGSAIIQMIISIVLSGVFLVTIIYVNAEMKEATYGGIEELLRGTSKPYWLVAFSVLNIIGVSLKGKMLPSTVGINRIVEAKRNCTGCGAEIPTEVQFCNQCGKKVDETPQVSNERFCTSCGAPIASGMAFCTSCGAKVESD